MVNLLNLVHLETPESSQTEDQSALAKMLSLTRFLCQLSFIGLAAPFRLTSVARRLRPAPAWTPSLPKTSQQHRTITNATKIDHVSALLDVSRVAPKPGGWKPTLIHSSGAVKFTVIRLDPGDEVPRHFHNSSWDYFMALSGQGVVKTKTRAGDEMDYDLNPQSFLAVPPGDIHVVRNKSHEEEFVFLIAQSPRHEYDFVDAKE